MRDSHVNQLLKLLLVENTDHHSNPLFKVLINIVHLINRLHFLFHIKYLLAMLDEILGHFDFILFFQNRTHMFLKNWEYSMELEIISFEFNVFLELSQYQVKYRLVIEEVLYFVINLLLSHNQFNQQLNIDVHYILIFVLLYLFFDILDNELEDELNIPILIDCFDCFTVYLEQQLYKRVVDIDSLYFAVKTQLDLFNKTALELLSLYELLIDH